MGHWVRERSLPVRVLVYAALATLAFMLAAGVGAVAALAMRGDVVGLLEAEQPRPTGDQDAAASGVVNGGADQTLARPPLFIPPPTRTAAATTPPLTTRA